MMVWMGLKNDVEKVEHGLGVGHGQKGVEGRGGAGCVGVVTAFRHCTRLCCVITKMRSVDH
jgi:hypothetical protein